jgi:hypothetical protein
MRAVAHTHVTANTAAVSSDAPVNAPRMAATTQAMSTPAVMAESQVSTAP